MNTIRYSATSILWKIKLEEIETNTTRNVTCLRKRMCMKAWDAIVGEKEVEVGHC